jgi:hypothetical protein
MKTMRHPLMMKTTTRIWARKLFYFFTVYCICLVNLSISASYEVRLQSSCGKSITYAALVAQTDFLLDT